MLTKKSEVLFSEQFKLEEMKAYEESLKTYRDQYSVIETARKEGKEEEKLETAKAMKAEGLSLDLIKKITGLTKEQIEKL